MKLLNGRELLDNLPANLSFIPCLDVSGGNIDMMAGYCETLRELSCPAFFSSTQQSIESYHGLDHFLESIAFMARKYQISVAAHIDHGRKPDFLERALKQGCRSLMFDGSPLTLDLNIEQTRKIADHCHKAGATLEGELGAIGGKEDDIEGADQEYPSLEQCALFCRETSVDFFAPGFGNKHGISPTEPKFQWDLLENLPGNTAPALLSLHGGSGVSVETLKKLLSFGFKKLNLASEPRLQFVQALRETLKDTKIQKPHEALLKPQEATAAFLRNFLESVGGLK